LGGGKTSSGREEAATQRVILEIFERAKLNYRCRAGTLRNEFAGVRKKKKHPQELISLEDFISAGGLCTGVQHVLPWTFGQRSWGKKKGRAQHTKGGGGREENDDH